ncbi:hypothetical protein [Micromonospora aurantiaca (nom. illeg.)]|uniref:hypothetical protein n=1 Tax=Micromonospora aurantiaca (nom. illeg.) TaxID=47850 RepID=UPI0033E3A82E
MSWPRRVTGVALLTAVLVLPPWLLATYAAPLLPGWPTGGQLRDWIADPLTARTLTGGLTALAWLLWLGVAYTVAVTTARRLLAGARWLRRVPLPTPWQAAATSMAGAAALTTVPTSTAGTPDPPIPASADGLHQHPSNVRIYADNGVTVAGGWLPDETCQQVTAAAGLVWLRRRRAYRPGRSLDGASLTPLPDTVTAVQAAAADRQLAPATATSPALPDLPALGVTFTGDGAADAARGVLVTRLLAALRDPPGIIRVLVTRAALTTLLPDLAAARVPIPGLRVADSVEEVTALLLSVAGTPTPSGGGSSPPVLALITAAPSAAAADRLTAGGADVVTLGAASLECAWHVDRHGHTRDVRTGQAGPRLCVLDRTAATDLLTVLAHPTTTLPGAGPSTSPAPQRPNAGARARIPQQPGRDTPHQVTLPSAASSAVRLRVLGRPALLIDGQPITIRRSAALQVLVLLAAHPDGATTTQLVQAIWPGLPAHTVTGRLYTTLSDLRAAVRAVTPVAVLASTDDRYQLDPEHVDVDLWRLQAAARHAAATLADPIPAWQAVVDAYTGDLATGHTWPWIDLPREAARRLVLDAYASLAAAHTDAHDRLRILQAAIRVDPYNQDLHQRAADELTALGDPAAAHRLLHTHRQLLHRAGAPASDPPIGAHR